MSKDNRRKFSLQFGLALLVVVPLWSNHLPLSAQGIDPSLLPPDVTIPYATPAASAPAQTPASNTPAPGLTGTGDGAPTAPIMSRRGLPMSASGVIQGGGFSNSAPPGMSFGTNQPANPYSRANGSIPMQTNPNDPPGLPGLTPELQNLQKVMQEKANAQMQTLQQAASGQAMSQQPVVAPGAQAIGAPDSVTPDGRPCYGCNQHKANQSADSSITLPNGTVVPISTGAKKSDPLAIVQTTKGTITIRLFRELAPQTVTNFLDLAQKGFYNGLTWHRVVPGFVVQTGCPKGDGTGSFVDPATNQTRYVPLEINSRLRHNAPGVVAMARFGNNPNSASSQWYITTAATPHLDSKYTVFGGVVNGLDTVYRITPQDRVTSVTIQGQ